MSELETFRYDKHLRSYIIQFAAVFAGIQVEVGKLEETEKRLITVPIKNASMDRVVGAIKGENTQNKPLRLPIMAFQLTGLEQAPEMRRGVGNTRRSTTMPTGGLFPNDLEVIEQRMPVPYKALFSLSVWTSNQDQHYQIMEQILSLFDPQIQIQVSDDVFDWTRITTVELMDVAFEENVPHGIDRRIIQSTLTFMVPIHLSVPTNIHQNVVNEIRLRIGAVSTDTETAHEILEDLDAQGIEYEKIFDVSDIDIDK